jgi:hypothetical protein
MQLQLIPKYISIKVSGSNRQTLNTLKNNIRFFFLILGPDLIRRIPPPPTTEVKSSRDMRPRFYVHSWCCA